MLHDLVQHASHRAGLLSGDIGGAQLTKNLRLAHDHRIEPGGHRKQVLHTGRSVMHVEVFGQLVQRHRALVCQDIGDIGQPLMKSCHHRVNLNPVTGGQQQRFSDGRTLTQLVQDLAGVRAGHRDSLQHLHRCAAVGQPHDQQTHRPTTPARSCYSTIAPGAADVFTASAELHYRSAGTEDCRQHQANWLLAVKTM